MGCCVSKVPSEAPRTPRTDNNRSENDSTTIPSTEMTVNSNPFVTGDTIHGAEQIIQALQQHQRKLEIGDKLAVRMLELPMSTASMATTVNFETEATHELSVADNTNATSVPAMSSMASHSHAETEMTTIDEDLSEMTTDALISGNQSGRTSVVPGPVKDGILKKNGKWNGFKDKFVSLRENRLTLYTASVPESERKLKHIDLTYLTLENIRAPNIPTLVPYQFEVVTPKHTYTFAASSAAERDDWLYTIHFSLLSFNQSLSASPAASMALSRRSSMLMGEALLRLNGNSSGRSGPIMIQSHDASVDLDTVDVVMPQLSPQQQASSSSHAGAHSSDTHSSNSDEPPLQSRPASDAIMARRIMTTQSVIYRGPPLAGLLFDSNLASTSITLSSSPQPSSLSASPLPQEEGPGLSSPMKAGLLTKQGGSWQNWKRRWFVLKENTLKYFDPNEIISGHELGTIPLQGMQSSGVHETTTDADCCFEVECVSGTPRTYYIQADSDKERDDWIFAIQQSILYHNGLSDRQRTGTVTNTTTTTTPAGSGPSSLNSHHSAVNEAVTADSAITMQRRSMDTRPPALKQGVLTKQGGIRKNWLERWFVLKENVLYYYKPDEVENGLELGTIVLTGMKQNQVVRGVENLHQIDVHTIGGRTFKLCAKGDRERDDWLTAMKESIAYYETYGAP